MRGSSGSRRSRRRQLQASHQKNWLIGRHAVLETLHAAKWPIEELLMAEDLGQDTAREVLRLAAALNLQPRQTSAERIKELCHAEHHQGLAARMGLYPYATMETLLAAARSDGSVFPRQQPLVVLCDRIQDAFNFGAILRCCDAMAVTGVVVGDSQQVSITPQVARSSAGAVNHITVALVADLIQATADLKQDGFLMTAASEKSSVAPWAVDLDHPIGLMIGGESQGIRPELLSQCHYRTGIPMLGGVSSLNAAVAAGILIYEIRRQQSTGGPS